MPDATLFRLQKVLNTAARILKKIPKFSHITDILKDLHWHPIRQRITFKILLLTYQAYYNTAPDCLCELITPYCSACNLRSNDMMLVRPCHPGPRLKTYGEKCFQFAAPKEWNTLPLLIRESPSIYILKSRLKTYLFNCAFNEKRLLLPFYMKPLVIIISKCILISNCMISELFLKHSVCHIRALF